MLHTKYRSIKSLAEAGSHISCGDDLKQDVKDLRQIYFYYILIYSLRCAKLVEWAVWRGQGWQNPVADPETSERGGFGDILHGGHFR